MATLMVNRVPSVLLHKQTSQPSLLARTLLLAVLFSHLPSITASPIPSLPAPGPGSDPGEALAPASDLEGDAFPGLSIEYSDLEVIDPTTGLHMQDDDDWDADYEDLVGEDERIGVDVMGNEVETDAERSPEPHPTAHPTSSHSSGPLTRPESLLASVSHLLDSGFWKGLLGSFLIFWVLIASTVGALLVVAVRVRRMERSGQLRRWRTLEEMSLGQVRKEGGECVEQDDDDDDDESV